jgi:hypothetical protein
MAKRFLNVKVFSGKTVEEAAEKVTDIPMEGQFFMSSHIISSPSEVNILIILEKHESDNPL